MAFPPYTPDFTEEQILKGAFQNSLGDCDDGIGGIKSALGGCDIYTIEYQFTSSSEIQRELSYRGVRLHLDDTNSSDENYEDGTHSEVTEANTLSEIIVRATAKVMEYLAPRYTAVNIYQKVRIREIATYFACNDLTRRRGNEPLFEAEVMEGIETLERYREGTLFLDAPSSPRAYLQSYVVDNRHYRNPVRVLRTSSTNTVSGQHLMWDYFPFHWL